MAASLSSGSERGQMLYQASTLETACGGVEGQPAQPETGRDQQGFLEGSPKERVKVKLGRGRDDWR